MGKNVKDLWGILLFLVLLTGCTSSNNQTKDSPPEKDYEQKATISVTQELNSIDPANTVDANSNITLNNIYEGLYRLDEKNEPKPAGALELPEIGEDGLTYLIKLRPEATWSTGEAVTADDYIYAWKRAISAKDATQNQYLYTAITGADDVLNGKGSLEDLGIHALDEETIQISLKQPTPYFTSLLAIPAFFPLKESYVMEQGEKFAATDKNAIYNGPFTIKDYKGPGIADSWQYVKNSKYWDSDSVKLESIQVKVVKDTATAVRLFEEGTFDDISISGEFAKTKADDPAFINEQTTQTVFLGYNQTQAFYQNAKIRQAISLLIDRETLTEKLLANGAQPATGLIFPGLFTHPDSKKDFASTSGNHLKADIQEAQQLWQEGKKELGLSESETIDIQLISFESEDMKKVTEHLKSLLEENFKEVTVKISIYPVSVFMKNASNQEFDIYLVSWGADYPDPTSLFKLFHSEVAYNWGKYQNKSYDQLLTDADTLYALEPNQRWETLLAIEQLLMETQGITPLYFTAPAYLRNEKLKQINYHNVGPRFEYKTAYMEK